MGRSGRLFLLLRPYALLFVANLVATFVASVMDGATFVLLIPFLRTLFGHDPLNVAGGSAVERLLAVVVGPLFAAGSPGAALRNVVLVLVAARSEEHTSELQSPDHLVCRTLLEKKT